MESQRQITNQLIKKIRFEDRGFQPINYLNIGYDNLFKISNNISELHINFLVVKNKLYTIGGWLQIYQVEKILSILLKKFGFSETEFATISSSKFLPVSNEFHAILNQAQSIELNNEINIEKVADLMWLYIENIFLPFWTKFSDIQIVNDSIVRIIPQMQLSSFIPGPYMDLKKLIIMKLCKSDDYEEYRDWLRKFEEEDYKNDPVNYKIRYDLFCELVKVLERGK